MVSPFGFPAGGSPVAQSLGKYPTAFMEDCVRALPPPCCNRSPGRPHRVCLFVFFFLN